MTHTEPRTDNQVYGVHYSRLRMKWTCKHCKQRNDSPLKPPYDAVEVFACRRCHKCNTFTANVEKRAE